MEFNVLSATHGHLRPEKKNGGKVKEKKEQQGSVKRKEDKE